MVDDLSAEGVRPVAIREYVLKLSSRCNLACDYCYVYEMADQSWRLQPKAMTPKTIDATCARIREHVSEYGLKSVRVVLHGGEPLLAGLDTLDYAASALRRAVPDDVGVSLALQTNGVLLDDDFLQMMHRHRIQVGVSLDGGRTGHDRHRRDSAGRGSYRAVSNGLRLLMRPEHHGLLGGLLCVIDVANDPVNTFEELLAFAPPAVDFLLPHGNWSNPPQGREPASAATAYGDWLAAAFDRWYSAPRQETNVRLFHDIISLLLGGAGGSEQIGLSPIAFVVVDTDGAFEHSDTAKSAQAGAAETGMNVFTHSVTDVLGHPEVVRRQSGVRGLAPTCQRCRLLRVCGGGHYAHRYRAGSGFMNRSVYCLDLQRLIGHVAAQVSRDLSRAAV